jgi:hypothetical protein
MKKNGLLSIFSVMTILGLVILGLVSCTRNKTDGDNTDEEYEIQEGFSMNYNIGERLENIRFTNMNLRRHYNGQYENLRVDDNFDYNIDYRTGMLNFKHLNNDISHKLENLNYISTSEELKGLENKTGIYVLNEGMYNVSALTFTEEITLIGAGRVKIYVNDTANNEAAITFTKNATISNIKIKVENSNMYSIKVNGTGTVERFHTNNVTSRGSRGVILKDVNKAYIDNSKFRVSEDSNSAIFNISCGSGVVFTNCRLTGGEQGSISILGNENCTQKNKVEFINTKVVGDVNIENYDLHKSEIFGLDWARTMNGNRVTYKAPVL